MRQKTQARTEHHAQMAARLRALRADAGKTQVEVAADLRLSVNTLSGWECGRVRPHIEYCVLLAGYYGCTLDYLLAGIPNEKQPAGLHSAAPRT